MPAGNKPCLTLSGSGGVQVSIWKNRKGNSEWFSAKISRRYKPEGSTEWRTTDSLGMRDLPTAAELCRQAFAELGVRRFGQGAAAPAVAMDEETENNEETTGDVPF